jgi:hypothetical protein
VYRPSPLDFKSDKTAPTARLGVQAAARFLNDTKGSEPFATPFGVVVSFHVPEKSLDLCFATTQEFSRFGLEVTIGRCADLECRRSVITTDTSLRPNRGHLT